MPLAFRAVCSSAGRQLSEILTFLASDCKKACGEKRLIPTFLKLVGADDEEIAIGCIAFLLKKSLLLTPKSITELKKLLERCGYNVSIQRKWERQVTVCKRLRISPSKFRRRLVRWSRSRQVDAQFGPKGRLVLIRSNPELDIYLSASAGSIGFGSSKRSRRARSKLGLVELSRSSNRGSGNVA